MIIQSKKVWVIDHFMPAQIEFEDGMIRAIYPYGSFQADLDVNTNWILPGFIDIHTHGGYGFNSMKPDQEGFDQYTKTLTHEGVTSFLISTITEEPVRLKEVLTSLASFSSGYAQKLGIHLEGPFLSAKKKGAHEAGKIIQPDWQLFTELQDCAKHQIKMVTVKAEDQDLSFIRKASGDSVVVSLGHSDADYEQAELAIANGATSFTHVYNAMSAFEHRHPNMVGAALNFPGVYGEIICDGIHSHFAAAELFFKLKGPWFSIMVSDSLSLKGQPAYSRDSFSGQTIVMDEKGKIVLEGSTTIAGSALKMNRALKNMIDNTEIPLCSLISSLTRNPATLLGLNNKGIIQAGKDADLIVLNEDFDVVHCFIQGRMIF